MGDPRATVSSPPTPRRTRPASEGGARGLERRPVGAADRRPVARSPAALSAVPNVSSSVSTMAAQRSAAAHSPTTGGRSPGSREARSQRGLHRRQLQLGEKRGSAVGPTRRGKGSKIMAIGDRHGLPVAVHVASASPHEVTLVDATLAARFLDELPARLIGDKAYDSDRLDQHLATAYDIDSSRPITPFVARKHKTAGRCVVTGGAGRSSGSLPGFTTSAASSRAGNVTRTTSSG